PNQRLEAAVSPAKRCQLMSSRSVCRSQTIWRHGSAAVLHRSLPGLRMVACSLIHAPCCRVRMARLYECLNLSSANPHRQAKIQKRHYLILCTILALILGIQTQSGLAQQTGQLPLAENGPYATSVQVMTLVDKARADEKLAISIWYPASASGTQSTGSAAAML